MKKSFITTCLFLGCLMAQAQSTVLLFEDFERGVLNDKLISPNNLSVYTNEKNEKKGSLYYNSEDTTAVSLNFSLLGISGVNEADSITACYINDFNSSRSNREKGTITIVRDTVSFQDSTVVSVGIGNVKLPFVLYLNANEIVDKAFYANNEGSVKVCKTFEKPLNPDDEIDIINLQFSKNYTLDGKWNEDAEMLVLDVCMDRFKDSMSAVQECIQDLSGKIPVMEARQMLIDDIEIKMYKPVVTSIDSYDLSKIDKKVVKAFNIKGQEVPVDTKNETLILKYDDGSTKRTFDLSFK